MQSSLMALVAAFVVICAGSTSPSAADDVLGRARAFYASLQAYADTGSVVIEYGSTGSVLREKHAFTTFFRKPRHFYFDFIKGEKPAMGRVVVWSDDELFHGWWSVTGVENTYPRGSGRTAFVTATPMTSGSVVMIAPLLFPGAGLSGTLDEFEPSGVDGTDVVGGRRCHKLVGIARSRYGTGHEFNVRRTTVWIDVETLLVRKVFEDTPRGTPAGTVSRTTMTFEPKANPTLDDSRFRFTPPQSP